MSTTFYGPTHEVLTDAQQEFVNFTFLLGMNTGMLVPGSCADFPGDEFLLLVDPDGNVVNPVAVHHPDDTVEVLVEVPSDDELADDQNSPLVTAEVEVGPDGEMTFS